MRLKVGFSANGAKTDINDILKALKKTPFRYLREEDLQRAFAVFRRQTEADFFIHKDAGGFLREQFDLWMFQYIYREESVFNEERLTQLRGCAPSPCTLLILSPSLKTNWRECGANQNSPAPSTMSSHG